METRDVRLPKRPRAERLVEGSVHRMELARRGDQIPISPLPRRGGSQDVAIHTVTPSRSRLRPRPNVYALPERIPFGDPLQKEVSTVETDRRKRVRSEVSRNEETLAKQSNQ